MAQSFIFGGDTGLSYEALKKRRELAEAMLAASSGRAPQNVGEGLTAIGQAIGGRIALNRVNKQEGTYRQRGIDDATAAYGGFGDFGAAAGGMASQPADMDASGAPWDIGRIGAQVQAQAPDGRGLLTADDVPKNQVAGMGNAGVGDALNRMAGAAPKNEDFSGILSYANQGAIRRQPLVPQLETELQRGVRSVYGDGYKVQVYSGGQPHKGHKGHRTGSTRHDGGNAADAYIIGPDGNRVRGAELARLGQYWAARKLGGVGMEMKGGGIHLDNHADRHPNWNYADKGGTYTPEMDALIRAGLEGKMPESMASPYLTADDVPKNMVAGMGDAGVGDALMAADAMEVGGGDNLIAIIQQASLPELQAMDPAAMSFEERNAATQRMRELADTMESQIGEQRREDFPNADFPARDNARGPTLSGLTARDPQTMTPGERNVITRQMQGMGDRLEEQLGYNRVPTPNPRRPVPEMPIPTPRPNFGRNHGVTSDDLAAAIQNRAAPGGGGIPIPTPRPNQGQYNGVTSDDLAAAIQNRPALGSAGIPTPTPRPDPNLVERMGGQFAQPMNGGIPIPTPRPDPRQSNLTADDVPPGMLAGGDNAAIADALRATKGGRVGSPPADIQTGNLDARMGGRLPVAPQGGIDPNLMPSEAMQPDQGGNPRDAILQALIKSSGSKQLANADPNVGILAALMGNKTAPMPASAGAFPAAPQAPGQGNIQSSGQGESYFPPAPQAPGQGQQGVGGLDPRLINALSNPYLPAGHKAVLGAMLQQQLAAMKPRSEKEALEIQKMRKDLNAIPERKMFKDANGRNRWEDTQEYVVKDIPAASPDMDTESKLRKEYIAGAKDFRDQVAAYQRVIDSASDPSPAGDLALIFNYMKILDPGSVVRESEFATAAASGSYGERLKAAGNQILSGERLSPAMRQDFVKRAGDLYRGAAGIQSETNKYYSGLSENYGIPPGRIIREPDAIGILDPEWVKESEMGVEEPEIGTIQDGYRFKGGDPSDPSSWEKM